MTTQQRLWWDGGTVGLLKVMTIGVAQEQGEERRRDEPSKRASKHENKWGGRGGS